MPQKKNNGFTLLELLVVIAIMSILFGIAWLGRDIIGREQVGSAARRLLADLQQARLIAMTGRQAVSAISAKGAGVKVHSSSSYSAFIFNDINNDWDYGGFEEEYNSRFVVLPSTLEISSNRSVLIFDALGYPRGEQWAAGWQTIIIRHRSLNIARCIRVHTNRIRGGTWNGTTCMIE